MSWSGNILVWNYILYTSKYLLFGLELYFKYLEYIKMRIVLSQNYILNRLEIIPIL